MLCPASTVGVGLVLKDGEAVCLNQSTGTKAQSYPKYVDNCKLASRSEVVAVSELFHSWSFGDG